MGAAPPDGAQGRRARIADRRAREMEIIVGVRCERKSRPTACRGGDAGQGERRGLCRSDAALRPSRLRRAVDHRRVLRHGWPDARCHGRAAGIRGQELLAETSVKSYRYYDFVMAAFVTVLLCSNFIGAAKQATVNLPLLGAVTFSAGVLFFPISYIFGDILTEVYGYARDRRVVWAGFAALAFASLSEANASAAKPAHTTR